MRASYGVLLSVVFVGAAWAEEPEGIEHVVVAIEKDRFHGWPANNGAWQWGDEFLVGYTQGDFVIDDGHNIEGIQESKFARSTDGGKTWEMFDPDNFLDDENIKWQPKGKKHLESAIDFSHEGFAMRIFASGYHGNDDPEGGFYYSYDRGQTWNGPYYLGNINDHPELKGKFLTPRTDYILISEREALIFITAHVEDFTKEHRVCCIKTSDGGMSFDFISWVTPATSEYRAVMPNTVQLSPKKFVLSYRKINADTSEMESTIDTYVSNDRCQTWRFQSTVKEIKNNSNPPALIRIKDGRLCCAYGDRDIGKVCAKYSDDEGQTWG